MWYMIQIKFVEVWLFGVDIVELMEKLRNVGQILKVGVFVDVIGYFSSSGKLIIGEGKEGFGYYEFIKVVGRLVVDIDNKFDNIIWVVKQVYGVVKV